METAERCFTCSGQKQVGVVTEQGGEYITIPTTCFRCKGTGFTSSGPFRNEIIDKLTNIPLPRPTPCLCDFEIHGPMGNPRCPAR